LANKSRSAEVGFLIAVLAWFAIGVAAVADGGNSAPMLTVGPFVQNLTSNSVTIMWEASTASFGEVKLTVGETEIRRRTECASRQGKLTLEGLKADTVYGYSVTLSSSPETTRRGAFRTFPANPRPTRFIVYGDTRTYPKRHRSVIDTMRAERAVDFVLHTGDLVTDGRKSDLWLREFFTPAREMMRNVPFYTVLGNHEHDSPNYFHRLSLPGNERWYSFDVADVHVVALDSNHSFDMGTDQYKWLLGDLAKHANARWKFIFMHHPTYTSGPHGATTGNGVPKEAPIREAQKLMPFLAKQYGIQAVFAGHDHAYERSERDGVQYVVAGGGGAPNYPDVGGGRNTYSRAFYSGLHYCVVTIDGGRASVVAKTPQGRVVDRFDLRAR